MGVWLNSSSALIIIISIGVVRHLFIINPILCKNIERPDSCYDMVHNKKSLPC